MRKRIFEMVKALGATSHAEVLGGRQAAQVISGQPLRRLTPAIWVLVLLALVVASPAAAQTDDDTVARSAAKPRFQVVDGDTVKFGPQLVRLFGIDAPET
jgi:endonuclease YncB( thermonuclease family)